MTNPNTGHTHDGNEDILPQEHAGHAAALVALCFENDCPLAGQVTGARAKMACTCGQHHEAENHDPEGTVQVVAHIDKTQTADPEKLYAVGQALRVIADNLIDEASRRHLRRLMSN